MGGRLIRGHREELAPGENRIVREEDTGDSVGIDFSIHRLGAGQRMEEASPKESVWLLMDGQAKVRFAGREQVVRRGSLFDEPPTALSVSARTEVGIESISDSEWAVARVSNGEAFEPRLFLPEMLKPEYRGKGLAQDACLRNVRLVFDLKERPQSKMVLGEVVNYPGRWSSYPPHHHAQPELYHYRFTEPQGYGHAELGEQVFKVRARDTIKIMGGESHAQVSAPGYGMYYLWIIRHLEDRPYRGFELSPEHRWLMDPRNQGWRPEDADG